jgi:hypothetical protein
LSSSKSWSGSSTVEDVALGALAGLPRADLVVVPPAPAPPLHRLLVDEDEDAGLDSEVDDGAPAVGFFLFWRPRVMDENMMMVCCSWRRSCC